MMVPRPRALDRISRAFSTHPIAALLGPRQCGKTTLARLIAEREPSTYFDLKSHRYSPTLCAHDNAGTTHWIGHN